MSWDGAYIPRKDRHAVEDHGLNAKQIRHTDPSAPESSTRKPANVAPTDKPGSRRRGDAVKFGYEQYEIDAFAKMGAPSVDDLSDRGRATREEKSSSP